MGGLQALEAEPLAAWALHLVARLTMDLERVPGGAGGVRGGVAVVVVVVVVRL